jgi:hypothetical protein
LFEHVFYPARVQAPRLPDPPSGRVFHVWVKLDLDGPRAPLPGLVLDWRRTGRGWEAWVVTVETYSTGTGEASMVRQGWRPVVYLRPAGSSPPAHDAWLRQPLNQLDGQLNGQANEIG